MSKGTVHACDRAAVQVTASSGLDEAAAGLGTEIVRFSRLIAAWKQRAKTDGGAADRVLLARLVVGGDQRRPIWPPTRSSICRPSAARCARWSSGDW